VMLASSTVTPSSSLTGRPGSRRCGGHRRSVRRRLRGPLPRWLASLPATTPFVSKRSSRTSPLPCPAALEPAHQGTQIVHRHWEKTSVVKQWTEEMPGFGNETQERLAKALKDEALRLGFDACGISKAEPLDEEARQLEAWLNAGMHAS